MTAYPWVPDSRMFLALAQNLGGNAAAVTRFANNQILLASVSYPWQPFGSPITP